VQVLVFAHTFGPSIGGVETYLHLLADGLTRLAPDEHGDRISVTVATRTPRADHDDAALPYSVERRPSARRLQALVDRADIVHLGGPVLGPLALVLARRRPFVVEHHGYQAICPNGLLLHEPDKRPCDGAFVAGRYVECVRCCASSGHGALAAVRQVALTFPRRWLASRASANVGVSNHVTTRVALTHPHTIHHGIVDPFGGAKEIAVLPPPFHPSRGPCFAYVGRLVSEKGLSLLIRAAAILAQERRAFRVKLIGDGPERESLLGLAKSIGADDRVELTGFLRGAVLEEAFVEVTAVVMPSIWEETAGLAAIEQMMRGRVVIAARTGGLAEIVGDAGLLFSPGDADALADAMRRICDSRELAIELGRAARTRAVARFQQMRMAEEHRTLYREVIAAHAAQPRAPNVHS
jgi:glycosyltransferase involved in cell wall biosynthesis